MKNDDAYKTATVLSVAWVAMVCLFVYGIYSIYNHQQSSGPALFQAVKMYSALLGGVVIFVLSVVLDYELVRVDADPNTTLAVLAHRLRVLRYRVKEDGKGLKVRMNPSTAIRITARTSAGRTVIRYKPEPTTGGWAALIILGFTFYLAMLAPAISITSIWRGRRFAQMILMPQLLAPRPPQGLGAAEEIKSALIDGLSEGYRLASEAYEAQYSNYHDGILAAVAGAIVVWFLSFVSFAALIRGHPLYSDLYASLLVSGIVTVVLMIPVFWYLRTKVKAKANEFKIWSVKLEIMLIQETRPNPPKDAEQSVFEVLDEISKQIPSWMRVMRRAGMFTDPWTWLAIFSLIYGAFDLTLVGIAWSPPNLPMQVLVLAFAAVLVLLSYLLYTRWRANQREEELEITTSWDSRLRKVRDKMQNHLEEI